MFKVMRLHTGNFDFRFKKKLLNLKYIAVLWLCDTLISVFLIVQLYTVKIAEKAKISISLPIWKTA